MLVLSRRIGETVHIGDGIEVIVLGIKGNQIRLGFNAPLNVQVHRKEVFERILANNYESPSPEAA